MAKRRNTRINTLFSEAAFDWLKVEADERSQSMAQVVREKIDLAKKDDALFERLVHLEKVIKKSHAVLAERLDSLR